MTDHERAAFGGAQQIKWPYTGQPAIHDGLREDDFYSHAALKAELVPQEQDEWASKLAPGRITPEEDDDYIAGSLTPVEQWLFITIILVGTFASVALSVWIGMAIWEAWR